MAVFRFNRVISRIERRKGLSIPECAGWLGSLIDKWQPVRLAIDEGGLGAGCADLLLSKYGDRIILPINFASKPVVPAPEAEDGKPGGGPANRRAELWLNAAKAFQGRRIACVDDPGLLADLVAPTIKYDHASRIFLESKEAMRKRGIQSPDAGDACASTFFEPLGTPVKKNAGRDPNFNRVIRYPTYVY